MNRSWGDLESCHRHDRETVLPQQALKAERLQAEYGINGEKGRPRARKRWWEIVKRVWEVVRLYSHVGSTPAPNSYCTPTSLSAKEIPLDQRWAVLTFVRTGRFQVLHCVMRTWSLFKYIYVSACENRRGSQDFYFFQTQPRLKYGDSCRYTNNRFSQSGFHSFCKLLFPFVIPWWEERICCHLATTRCSSQAKY
jgi:hypothetical protein